MPLDKLDAMPAFESHDALLEHDGGTCDGLYADAIERGVVQPIIIVLDLLDPMGKEMAILMEAVSQELADGVVEMSEKDGESSTIILDLSHQDALQMFASMPDDECAPLEATIPPGRYRLAVFAADTVAFHDRDIPTQSGG